MMNNKKYQNRHIAQHKEYHQPQRQQSQQITTKQKSSFMEFLGKVFLTLILLSMGDAIGFNTLLMELMK